MIRRIFAIKGEHFFVYSVAQLNQISPRSGLAISIPGTANPGRSLLFTRTQAGVNHSFNVSSDAESDSTAE
jgi:hypothetical protein